MGSSSEDLVVVSPPKSILGHFSGSSIVDQKLTFDQTVVDGTAKFAINSDFNVSKGLKYGDFSRLIAVLF